MFEKLAHLLQAGQAAMAVVTREPLSAWPGLKREGLWRLARPRWPCKPLASRTASMALQRASLGAGRGASSVARWWVEGEARLGSDGYRTSGSAPRAGGGMERQSLSWRLIYS